jgi:hypothetical protein
VIAWRNDTQVTTNAMEQKEKKLHKKYAYMILNQVVEILKQEKSLVEVDVPQGERITVCGDVHGQVRAVVLLCFVIAPCWYACAAFV